MPVSGRKAETIFHEVLSLWTLYGKRFRHRRIRSGQVFRRDKTAGAGDYLVYLGGWTRYGSRPRPEGTPSSVDRSNTQRSVAPSDKGSANQHQRSTRSSTKRPDLPGASPRSTGHPHTWIFSARHAASARRARE